MHPEVKKFLQIASFITFIMLVSGSRIDVAVVGGGLIGLIIFGATTPDSKTVKEAHEKEIEYIKEKIVKPVKGFINKNQ